MFWHFSFCVCLLPVGSEWLFMHSQSTRRPFCFLWCAVKNKAPVYSTRADDTHYTLLELSTLTHSAVISSQTVTDGTDSFIAFRHVRRWLLVSIVCVRKHISVIRQMTFPTRINPSLMQMCFSLDFRQWRMTATQHCPVMLKTLRWRQPLIFNLWRRHNNIKQ